MDEHTRTRAAKVISVRLLDTERERVEHYIAEGRAQTMTGAVQDLVSLGLDANADARREAERRSVDDVRALVVRDVKSAHRLIHELMQTDPLSARRLAIDVMQTTGRLVGRVNESADAWVESKMKSGRSR